MRPLVFGTTLVLAAAAAAHDVYLLPAPEVMTMEYATPSASAAVKHIAQWLGVDRLDKRTRDGRDSVQYSAWSVDNVFGEGKAGKTLVLALDGAVDDVQELLPEEMGSARFHPKDEVHRPFAASTVLASLVSRARTILGSASIHTLSSYPTSTEDLPLDTLALGPTVTAQLAALSAFLDSSSDSHEPTFGAFRIDITDLQPEFRPAVRAALQSVAAQPHLRAAVLVVRQPAVHFLLDNRQPPQQPLPPTLPPSHPIYSSDTCFASADACTNGTSACSSRGECVGVKRGARECFACACRRTTDGAHTTHWAGDRCEKIDISGQFALLVGTTVLVLVLIGGSVAVLAGVGGDKLPSVLASVAVPGMRD